MSRIPIYFLTKDNEIKYQHVTPVELYKLYHWKEDRTYLDEFKQENNIEYDFYISHNLNTVKKKYQEKNSTEYNGPTQKVSYLRTEKERTKDYDILINDTSKILYYCIDIYGNIVELFVPYNKIHDQAYWLESAKTYKLLCGPNYLPFAYSCQYKTRDQVQEEITNKICKETVYCFYDGTDEKLRNRQYYAIKFPVEEKELKNIKLNSKTLHRHRSSKWALYYNYKLTDYLKNAGFFNNNHAAERKVYFVSRDEVLEIDDFNKEMNKYQQYNQPFIEFYKKNHIYQEKDSGNVKMFPTREAAEKYQQTIKKNPENYEYYQGAFLVTRDKENHEISCRPHKNINGFYYLKKDGKSIGFLSVKKMSDHDFNRIQFFNDYVYNTDESKNAYIFTSNLQTFENQYKKINGTNYNTHFTEAMNELEQQMKQVDDQYQKAESYNLGRYLENSRDTYCYVNKSNLISFVTNEEEQETHDVIVDITEQTKQQNYTKVSETKCAVSSEKYTCKKMIDLLTTQNSGTTYQQFRNFTPNTRLSYANNYILLYCENKDSQSEAIFVNYYDYITSPQKYKDYQVVHTGNNKEFIINRDEEFCNLSEICQANQIEVFATNITIPIFIGSEKYSFVISNTKSVIKDKRGEELADIKQLPSGISNFLLYDTAFNFSNTNLSTQDTECYYLENGELKYGKITQQDIQKKYVLKVFVGGNFRPLNLNTMKNLASIKYEGNKNLFFFKGEERKNAEDIVDSITLDTSKSPSVITIIDKEGSRKVYTINNDEQPQLKLPEPTPTPEPEPKKEPEPEPEPLDLSDLLHTSQSTVIGQTAEQKEEPQSQPHPDSPSLFNVSVISTSSQSEEPSKPSTSSAELESEPEPESTLYGGSSSLPSMATSMFRSQSNPDKPIPVFPVSTTGPSSSSTSNPFSALSKSTFEREVSRFDEDSSKPLNTSSEDGDMYSYNPSTTPQPMSNLDPDMVKILALYNYRKSLQNKIEILTIIRGILDLDEASKEEDQIIFNYYTKVFKKVDELLTKQLKNSEYSLEEMEQQESSNQELRQQVAQTSKELGYTQALLKFDEQTQKYIQPISDYVILDMMNQDIENGKAVKEEWPILPGCLDDVINFSDLDAKKQQEVIVAKQKELKKRIKINTTLEDMKTFAKQYFFGVDGAEKLDEDLKQRYLAQDFYRHLDDLYYHTQEIQYPNEHIAQLFTERTDGLRYQHIPLLISNKDIINCIAYGKNNEYILQEKERELVKKDLFSNMFINNNGNSLNVGLSSKNRTSLFSLLSKYQRLCFNCKNFEDTYNKNQFITKNPDDNTKKEELRTKYDEYYLNVKENLLSQLVLDDDTFHTELEVLDKADDIKAYLIDTFNRLKKTNDSKNIEFIEILRKHLLSDPVANTIDNEEFLNSYPQQNFSFDVKKCYGRLEIQGDANVEDCQGLIAQWNTAIDNMESDEYTKQTINTTLLDSYALCRHIINGDLYFPEETRYKDFLEDKKDSLILRQSGTEEILMNYINYMMDDLYSLDEKENKKKETTKKIMTLLANNINNSSLVVKGCECSKDEEQQVKSNFNTESLNKNYSDIYLDYLKEHNMDFFDIDPLMIKMTLSYLMTNRIIQNQIQSTIEKEQKYENPIQVSFINNFKESLGIKVALSKGIYDIDTLVELYTKQDLTKEEQQKRSYIQTLGEEEYEKFDDMNRFRILQLYNNFISDIRNRILLIKRSPEKEQEILKYINNPILYLSIPLGFDLRTNDEDKYIYNIFNSNDLEVTSRLLLEKYVNFSKMYWNYAASGLEQTLLTGQQEYPIAKQMKDLQIPNSCLLIPKMENFINYINSDYVSTQLIDTEAKDILKSNTEELNMIFDKYIFMGEHVKNFYFTNFIRGFFIGTLYHNIQNLSFDDIRNPEVREAISCGDFLIKEFEQKYPDQQKRVEKIKEFLFAANIFFSNYKGYNASDLDYMKNFFNYWAENADFQNRCKQLYDIHMQQVNIKTSPTLLINDSYHLFTSTGHLGPILEDKQEYLFNFYFQNLFKINKTENKEEIKREIIENIIRNKRLPNGVTVHSTEDDIIIPKLPRINKDQQEAPYKYIIKNDRENLFKALQLQMFIDKLDYINSSIQVMNKEGKINQIKEEIERIFPDERIKQELDIIHNINSIKDFLLRIQQNYLNNGGEILSYQKINDEICVSTVNENTGVIKQTVIKDKNFVQEYGELQKTLNEIIGVQQDMSMSIPDIPLNLSQMPDLSRSTSSALPPLNPDLLPDPQPIPPIRPVTTRRAARPAPALYNAAPDVVNANIPNGMVPDTPATPDTSTYIPTGHTSPHASSTTSTSSTNGDSQVVSSGPKPITTTSQLPTEVKFTIDDNPREKEKVDLQAEYAALTKINPVEPQGKDIILSVGDVHGSVKAMLQPLLHNGIIELKYEDGEYTFKRGKHINKFKRIIFLGDYVDRGNFSFENMLNVKRLDTLINGGSLDGTNDKLKFICGNHDVNSDGICEMAANGEYIPDHSENTIMQSNLFDGNNSMRTIRDNFHRCLTLAHRETLNGKTFYFTHATCTHTIKNTIDNKRRIYNGYGEVVNLTKKGVKGEWLENGEQHLCLSLLTPREGVGDVIDRSTGNEIFIHGHTPIDILVPDGSDCFKGIACNRKQIKDKKPIFLDSASSELYSQTYYYNDKENCAHPLSLLINDAGNYTFQHATISSGDNGRELVGEVTMNENGDIEGSSFKLITNEEKQSNLEEYKYYKELQKKDQWPKLPYMGVLIDYKSPNFIQLEKYYKSGEKAILEPTLISESSTNTENKEDIQTDDLTPSSHFDYDYEYQVESWLHLYVADSPEKQQETSIAKEKPEIKVGNTTINLTPSKEEIKKLESLPKYSVATIVDKKKDENKNTITEVIALIPEGFANNKKQLAINSNNFAIKVTIDRDEKSENYGKVIEVEFGIKNEKTGEKYKPEEARKLLLANCAKTRKNLAKTDKESFLDLILTHPEYYTSKDCSVRLPQFKNEATQEDIGKTIKSCTEKSLKDGSDIMMPIAIKTPESEYHMCVVVATKKDNKVNFKIFDPSKALQLENKERVEQIFGNYIYNHLDKEYILSPEKAIQDELTKKSQLFKGTCTGISTEYINYMIDTKQKAKKLTEQQGEVIQERYATDVTKNGLHHVISGEQQTEQQAVKQETKPQDKPSVEKKKTTVENKVLQNTQIKPTLQRPPRYATSHVVFADSQSLNQIKDSSAIQSSQSSVLPKPSIEQQPLNKTPLFKPNIRTITKKVNSKVEETKKEVQQVVEESQTTTQAKNTLQEKTTTVETKPQDKPSVKENKTVIEEKPQAQPVVKNEIVDKKEVKPEAVSVAVNDTDKKPIKEEITVRNAPVETPKQYLIKTEFVDGKLKMTSIEYKEEYKKDFVKFCNDNHILFTKGADGYGCLFTEERAQDIINNKNGILNTADIFILIINI